MQESRKIARDNLIDKKTINTNYYDKTTNLIYLHVGEKVLKKEQNKRKHNLETGRDRLIRAVFRFGGVPDKSLNLCLSPPSPITQIGNSHQPNTTFSPLAYALLPSLNTALRLA